MVARKISDEDVMEWIPKIGIAETARRFGLSQRALYSRRRDVETRYNTTIEIGQIIQSDRPRRAVRRDMTITDGLMVVSSDHHIWPNELTTAYLAIEQFTKTEQPTHQVINGDLIDGAQISRHPPLGWDHTPTIGDEIEACQQFLARLDAACPTADRLWLRGNHDDRFDMKLVAMANEFKDVPGFQVSDLFPGWDMRVSAHINETNGRPQCVLKHNWKGGLHAAFNNAKESGTTMVTGHTHRLLVTPFNDYGGIRWGVETGTSAEPYGPQFDYSKDNPRNHNSGFAVLTWKDGELLTPELARVVRPGEWEFRGKRYTVKL